MFTVGPYLKCNSSLVSVKGMPRQSCCLSRGEWCCVSWQLWFEEHAWLPCPFGTTEACYDRGGAFFLPCEANVYFLASIMRQLFLFFCLYYKANIYIYIFCLYYESNISFFSLYYETFFFCLIMRQMLLFLPEETIIINRMLLDPISLPILIVFFFSLLFVTYLHDSLWDRSSGFAPF